MKKWHLIVLLVVFCIVFVGCVSDNSDKGAMYYFNKGLEADDAGDCEKAIEYYDKALEVDPKLASAMQNKVSCLVELNRTEESLSTLNRMLSYNSNISYWWHWKGNMLFDLGRYNESVTSYRKAIQVYDKDNLTLIEEGLYENSTYLRNVWYNMCLSLANLDRYNESIAACKNALEFDPYFGDTHLIIAEVYMCQKEYILALQKYNSLLESSDSHPASLLGKSRALGSLGIYGEALNTLEKIPEKHRRREFYYLKGVVLYGLGRYDESLESVNRSLSYGDDEQVRDFYDAVVEAKKDTGRKINVTKYLKLDDVC